jgi:hypothetical protein
MSHKALPLVAHSCPAFPDIQATSIMVEALGQQQEIKKGGKFTLPSFGTFTVHKTKARKGVNPRTGEAIKTKPARPCGSRHLLH